MPPKIIGRSYKFYRLRKKSYDPKPYKLLKIKDKYFYFKGFDGRVHEDYFKEFFTLV